MVREEVQSVKRTDRLTIIRMIEKVVGKLTKGESSRENGLRTPTIDIDMVGFILSRFWVSFDQLDSLIEYVFTKEVE